MASGLIIFGVVFALTFLTFVISMISFLNTEEGTDANENAGTVGIYSAGALFLMFAAFGVYAGASTATMAAPLL